MVVGVGEARHCRPDVGTLLVPPAEENPAEPHDAWASDKTLAEGIDRFQAHATVEITRLLASWAGLRTFVPDQQPVLGLAPADEPFLWCAGQGGYGFQTACAARWALPEAAQGRDAELRPGRFR